MFYYGTQYYRPPNPDPADWDRDLGRISELGFNLVKLWAMWNHCNPRRGEYDFSALERLARLCEKHGLKFIINSILENAPYWLAHEHPEGLYCANDGMRVHLQARPNTPGGGWPGMCLDNEPVREAAAGFLAALAGRFKGHPALYGYDVWNETFHELPEYYGGRTFCYCEASIERFRNWLKARYGSLEGLNEAWKRRYVDWAHVEPPRFFGGYPDWLDWTEFRAECFVRQMAWRLEVFSCADPEALLTSHGICGTFGLLPTHLNDDRGMAAQVAQWGVSSFPGMGAGSGASSLMARVDLNRFAARGKPVWQTELQGGRVTGCGTGTKPSGLSWEAQAGSSDIAVWNWAALAAGAKGLLYWQYRPEVLGPESPGFGLTAPDGGLTERTAAASRFARFTAAHPELFEAGPERPKVAVAVCNESQRFNYVAEGSARMYSASLLGFYSTLAAQNIPCGFAWREEFEEFEVLFLPFPLLLNAETASRLRRFVEGGGTLVSEPCPAWFIDHGLLSPRCPGHGLDEVFGLLVRETEPYLPCRPGEPAHLLPVARHRALLELRGAEVVREDEGGPLLTSHGFGSGRAMLLATFAGGYASEGGAELILAALGEAGVTPGPGAGSGVLARFHRGAERDFLYLVNETAVEKRFEARLEEYAAARCVETGRKLHLKDGVLGLSVPARDGMVVELVRREVG